MISLDHLHDITKGREGSRGPVIPDCFAFFRIAIFGKNTTGYSLSAYRTLSTCSTLSQFSLLDTLEKNSLRKDLVDATYSEIWRQTQHWKTQSGWLVTTILNILSKTLDTRIYISKTSSATCKQKPAFMVAGWTQWKPQTSPISICLNHRLKCRRNAMSFPKQKPPKLLI